MLKDNDIQGLDYLIRRYQIQAVQSAYLIVGDRSLAEDIVQSAFIKIIDKIGTFDSKRSFGPWFLQTVIHASIRAAYRAQRDFSFEAGEELPFPPAWIIDPGQGPEELADTSEVQDAVWKALQRLSPRQRAVTVMSYFLDMPDKYISRTMNSPLTAIKWSLYAARERLRHLLASFSPDGKHPSDKTTDPKVWR